jgi:hypothetical protein
MGIEESIKTRIGQLLTQSNSHAVGDEHGQATSERQCQGTNRVDSIEVIQPA